MNSKVFLILRMVVSLALMAALIYVTRNSIPRMLDALKLLPAHIFLLGFFIFSLSLLIGSFRLKILLGTQGIFLNLGNLLRLTLMGYFFSSFLPTAVGGDVVKAFYISRTSSRALESYTSVFMDRFLGMCSIFLIATVSLFFIAGAPELHLKWLLPVFLAGGVIFLMFLFNRRAANIVSLLMKPVMPANIRKKIKNVYDALHGYRKHKSKIVACILISIVGQVMGFSAAYIFGVGLNSNVPLGFVLFTMPMASIASMLPSLYGMGPREATMVAILSPLAGEEMALAIAFLWLGVLLITALIGGITYLLIGWHTIRLDDMPDCVPQSEAER